MKIYFETLHNVANTNEKKFDSLKDLTIAVAQSGGYRRELVTLKNGKQVMRTRYNNPATWDDTLVARWLCEFEALFKSKLCPHSELKEFFPGIIQRTFSIYFNALQIDKLSSDTNVVTVVYMCLANRIGEALISKGSVERLKRHSSYKPSKVKSSRDRVVMRSILNYISNSYDDLPNLGVDIVDSTADKSDLIMDLTKRLSGNPFGDRLLDSMIFSSKRDRHGKSVPVNFSNIRDYMYLSEEEISHSATRNFLNSAYRVIINTIKEYYPDYDYDSLKPISFKLNRVSKNISEMCR